MNALLLAAALTISVPDQPTSAPMWSILRTPEGLRACLRHVSAQSDLLCFEVDQAKAETCTEDQGVIYCVKRSGI